MNCAEHTDISAPKEKILETIEGLLESFEVVETKLFRYLRASGYLYGGNFLNAQGIPTWISSLKYINTSLLAPMIYQPLNSHKSVNTDSKKNTPLH